MAADLDSVPGLVDVLNSLTEGLDESVKLELKSQFDLNRYQDHVSKCLTSEPMDLREIPPLIENQKIDLISLEEVFDEANKIKSFVENKDS